MIVFRHADPRFPFLWEEATQPSARWHGSGEGPAHYFAETSDGAWAEFIRHEEITDPADLATVRRSMWAVQIPDEPSARPRLSSTVTRGGLSTYAQCREEAGRLRAAGARGLRAPSAALTPGTRSGWRVRSGLQPGRARNESVIVLFGARPDLVGWAACHLGHPRADLLPRVNGLTP